MTNNKTATQPAPVFVTTHLAPDHEAMGPQVVIDFDASCDYVDPGDPGDANGDWLGDVVGDPSGDPGGGDGGGGGSDPGDGDSRGGGGDDYYGGQDDFIGN